MNQPMLYRRCALNGNGAGLGKHLPRDDLRLRHRARPPGKLDRVVELRVVAVREGERGRPPRHRIHVGRIEGKPSAAAEGRSDKGA